VFNTDQGSQFTSTSFIEELLKQQVRVEIVPFLVETRVAPHLIQTASACCF